jgi:hypothetical protein
MRTGGALGRLLPCDELPCPLLPAAAAALVDGPPPAPPLTALALPLPLPFACLPCAARHPPRATSCSARGGAHPCDGTSHRSPAARYAAQYKSVAELMCPRSLPASFRYTNPVSISSVPSNRPKPLNPLSRLWPIGFVKWYT